MFLTDCRLWCGVMQRGLGLLFHGMLRTLPSTSWGTYWSFPWIFTWRKVCYFCSTSANQLLKPSTGLKLNVYPTQWEHVVCPWPTPLIACTLRGSRSKWTGSVVWNVERSCCWVHYCQLTITKKLVELLWTSQCTMQWSLPLTKRHFNVLIRFYWINLSFKSHGGAQGGALPFGSKGLSSANCCPRKLGKLIRKKPVHRGENDSVPPLFNFCPRLAKGKASLDASDDLPPGCLRA